MSHAPTFPSQLKTESTGMMVMLGIAVIILGLLAMMAPLLTGITIALLVGVLLVAAGISRCIYAFQAHSWGRGILGFIVGLLAIACGILMLLYPVINLISLTLLLAGYFIVHGIFEIALGIQLRARRNWGWLIFNGIVSLLLGILIWRQWPLSGVWAIGLLVGINMFLSGVAMIAMGAAPHDTTTHDTTTTPMAG